MQYTESLALCDKLQHSSIFSTKSHHGPSQYINKTGEEDNIWDSVQNSHPGSLQRYSITALKLLIHSHLKAVFLQFYFYGGTKVSMYQQLPLVWKFYYQVRKVLIHKITVGLAPAKLALLYLELIWVYRLGKLRAVI